LDDAVFNKNVQYFEKAFPRFTEILLSSKENPDFQVDIETAKNGLLNIKVKSEKANVYLHSNYDQEREVEALLENLTLDKKDTFIIFGFGMGYHVEKLIRTYPNIQKIIIEPSSDIFKCVLKYKDVTNIMKTNNTRVIVTDNPNVIVQNLMDLHQNGFISSIEFLALPSYKRLYGELWQTIKEMFLKYFRSFSVNVNTSFHFKEDWLNNFLLNIKHIPDSLDLIALGGKFQDVPAILVSAGPSLNKNIELLREVGSKALILAAGSTITILQNKDIKPHIMLGIDGGQVMTDLYSTVKWTDIFLAYVTSIHHGCLDIYKGPKIYVRSDAEPQAEWMEQMVDRVSQPVKSGGSCANVAMDFLKKLGCNPIIFVGQDLAFTDMQFYADGHANEELIRKMNIDPTVHIKTKDVFGHEIYTTHNWLTMANYFEVMMARYGKDHLFINSTEGGLPLKGSQAMTLREAIDNYCTEDRDIITQLERLFVEASRGKTELRGKMIDFVTELQAYCNDISEISAERIKLVKKILFDIQQGSFKTVASQGKKLTGLTEKLEKSIMFEKIIDLHVYNILLVIKNKSETAANQTGDTKEKMQILYQGLKTQFELVEEINMVIRSAGDKALDRLKQEV
jgi:hypothetical protein